MSESKYKATTTEKLQQFRKKAGIEGNENKDKKRNEDYEAHSEEKKNEVL